MRNIVVLSAGLGSPSSTRLLADRVAAAVVAQVGARGEEAQVQVIELRELAVAIGTAMATGGVPTPELDAAKAAVAGADGLVAVTPVFTASYSGLFKSFVDLLDPDSLTGLPVIVAATAGTARHSLVLDHAMRPLFSHLRAVVVPTGVFAATEDFGGSVPDDEANEGGTLAARVQRAAAELAALVVADATGVEGFVPTAPKRATAGLPGTGPTTPFAQLLRGHTGD